MAFVSDASQLGSPAPTRSLARLGALLLLSGISRAGPVSSPSVVDSAPPELPPSTRSMTQTGAAMPVLCCSNVGPVALMRSHACLGVTAFVPGMACAGLLFRMPVPDCSHIGSPPLAQKRARSSSAASVLGFFDFGSLTAVRSFARLGFACSLVGVGRSGSRLLAPDLVQLDSSVPVRSAARFGFATMTLDISHPGSFFPVRSMARLGSPTAATGVSAVGPIFSLSVLGCATPDLPLPTRSRAWIALPLFTPDYLTSGLMPLSQQFLQPEASVSMPGPSRHGSLFSLSVVDMPRTGSVLLLRSLTHVSSSLSVPDPTHPGAPPSLRSFSQPGITSLVSSAARSASLMLLPDGCYTGLPTFLRRRARMDLSVLAPGVAKLGFAPSLQQFCRAGLTASVSGLTCLGFVFLLLVTESTRLGVPVSTRSFSKPELAVPISGYGHVDTASSSQSVGRAGSVALVYNTARPELQLLLLDDTCLGLTVFLRSFACPGLPVPTFQFARCGSSSPPRSTACPGPVVPTTGIARVGSCSSLFAADTVHPGASPAPQSFARVDSSLPSLDHSTPELPLSLRGLGKIGLTSPASGVTRADLLSLLSVTETAALGSLMPTRGLSCLGTNLPALSSSHAASVSSSQSFMRSGSMATAFGMSCVGLVFALLVVDVAQLGSAFFARRFARTGLGMSPLSAAWPDPSTPSRSHTHLDPVLLAFQAHRLGFPSLVLGVSLLGASLLSRSLSRPDASMLPFQAASLEAFSLLRSFSCLGSRLLVVGLTCVGFVFLLFVTETMHAESLPPPRSSAHCESSVLAFSPMSLGSMTPLRHMGCLGPASFVSAYTHIGSMASSRSMAKMGFSATVPGLGRLGFVFFLSVIQTTRLGPSALARSLSRLGTMPLVLKLAGAELVLPVRSPAQAGLPLLALGLAQFDSLSTLQSPTKSGPLLPVSGVLCTGPLSLLSATDPLQPGLLLPPHSPASLGSAVPALDSLQLGSLSSLRSLERPGVAAPVLDYAIPGSPSLVRGPACADVLTLVSGMSWSGLVSILSVAGVSQLGLSAVLRSLAKAESTASLPNLAKMDVPLMLHSPGCSSIPLPICGESRLDPTALVLDHMHSGPVISSHSSGHSDVPVSTLQLANFGSLLPLRGLSHPDPMVLATGLARPGLCSSPSAAEMAHVEVSLFLHALAKPESEASALALAHVASAMLPRNSVRAGLAAPACGLTCVDPTAFVLDACQIDLSAFARSPA